MTVTDLRDPRLDPFTRLTDMQLRMVKEPAEGIFLAEGEKVIRRAVAAGLRPIGALMQPKWWPGLEGVLPPDTEVFLAGPDQLKQITGYRLHRGALATFRRPTAPAVSSVLDGARTAIVLEDLVDHTNVGAVFRSAYALGVGAVLVTRRCADPWYRRSVKTSMGAVFSMPWTVVPDIGAALSSLADRGFRTLALQPDGTTALADLNRAPRTAVVLGTEGDGLTDEALRLCDAAVRIPMREAADSLNVAAAAAIACYALAGSEAATSAAGR